MAQQEFLNFIEDRIIDSVCLDVSASTARPMPSIVNFNSTVKERRIKHIEQYISANEVMLLYTTEELTVEKMGN